MKEKTKGAWLVHHTNKLRHLEEIGDFEEVNTAGKCGLLLSAICESENQSNISADKLNIIAKSAGITRLELRSVLGILSKERLINESVKGDVSVLGLTTTNVLTKTAEIFDLLNPSKEQIASLEISEIVSEKPEKTSFLKEYISDTHKLTTTSTSNLITNMEEVGFIDSEPLDGAERLFFNGNLFRKDDVGKANKVFSSLKDEENRRIRSLDAELEKYGCIALPKGIHILGRELLDKLLSIGLYDLNKVANDREEVTFISKPSAFGKFGNPFEEDALDLAKAFVSSLTYGMIFSRPGRGKITYLNKLLKNLISGYWVGPATAIGEDYRILEFKNVIKIKPEGKNMYFMKLLKKDVGELALQVLNNGDASEQTVLALSSGSVTSYVGPEKNRSMVRRKQTVELKQDIIETLRTLRS